MQTNLLWTGLEYHSLENCLVTTNDGGSEINSTIVGKYHEVVYHVEYKIKVNANWETLFVEVHSRHSDRFEKIVIESDESGNWKLNEKEAVQFTGCVDVDIPLTPFTNTLPVNRLNLAPGAERQIKVIYLDILQSQMAPVIQKYTRLSETQYRYENVPNDFEAVVTVNEDGFVVDYPSLFVRTAKLSTHYPS
jgi:uncharacterized protein